MAQGRHLRLYARYLPHLNDRNVDPKGLPPSLLGWAPFLEDLTGKWAVDIVYGYKIRGILQKIIEEPAGGTDEAHWAEPQIEKLKQRGIILHDHHPEETVVFGVLATMLNRVLDQTTE